jgi:hypothetical protein
VYFDVDGFDEYPILGFAKRAADYYPRRVNTHGGWGGRSGASKDGGTVKVALVNAGACSAGLQGSGPCGCACHGAALCRPLRPAVAVAVR